MDKTRPTKKQKELLNFIDGFIKGYGYGPSYREIMRALDYKSVSTVAVHVNSLITRGWLVKRDNSARSLVVMMPEETDEKPIDPVEQALANKLRQLERADKVDPSALDALKRAIVIMGYELK